MANFDSPWEIRTAHRPRHSVRPRRGQLRRWLNSIGRQIGEAFLEAFRPVSWMPEDWAA